MFRAARLLCLSLVLSSPALAQDGRRFELSPQFGVQVPMNPIGPAAPTETAWYLDLERPDAAPSFGVTASVTWPGRWVGARVSAGYTLPSDVHGIFNCYPGLACPSILLESDANVESLTLIVDALLYPLARFAKVRPYIVTGLGVRRFRYEWPEAFTFVTAGSHAETRPVVNGGLGVAVDLLGASLHLELTDAWSPEGDGAGGFRLQTAGPVSHHPQDLPSRAQHVIGVSLGVRVLRF